MKKIDITIAILQSFFRKHQELSLVKLYGSRAKGNHKPNSDYDLTILMKENISITDAHKVIYDIKDEVESTNLPYLFDIQFYNDIDNTALRDHIDRVGIIIFDQKFDQILQQSSPRMWNDSMLNQIIEVPELAHIVSDIKQYPNVVNPNKIKKIIDSLERFGYMSKYKYYE